MGTPRKRHTLCRRLMHLTLASSATALLLAASASAQVITAFSPRFSTNDTGDVAIIGNTLLTCSSSASGCAAAQAGTGSSLNNNDFVMGYVDVDSDATTFNSSRATLSLPSGSVVLFAGLYWGADTSAGTSGSAATNAALRNQVQFITPVSGTYLSRSGTQVGLSGTRYHSFNDVTALVQAGGNGTYGVANVQAGRGSDRYAGWSLVVVYRAPSQPPRNLIVLDGYALVSSSSPNVNINLSGFTTPPAGPVITRLGVVAYEGDLGLTGDALRLNSTTISDALNPAANFFNSTVSRLGTRLNAKSPDYVNQLGFDADVVDASGILANGSTSATINLTTGGETYFPGVVTFATELFAPNIPAAKTATDLNGGNLQPGDVIEYVVTASNTGQDPATLVVLTDDIPAHTTYVPGSLVVLSGPNAGAKTDAAGDDQGNFDTINNRVIFRLGSGANASSGGTLGVGVSTSIRFRVTVDAPTPNATVITNQAGLTYTGQTLGGGFAGASSAPSLAVVSNPVLAAPKTVLLLADNDFNGIPSPGDVLRYQVVVSNSGTGFATGVVLTDTPDSNTTLVAASVTTSQGTIASGNAGTPPVTVNLGTIPNGGSATVTFDVTINPLPAGVTTVRNQGAVSSNELPTLLTDDPTLGGSADPTVTAVTGAPLLRAEKVAVLVADNDLNGVPSPGDRLQYNITILNIGNAAATGVVFNDIPDPNTALVVGTVTTSSGMITSGNSGGDVGVTVQAGVLPAAGNVAITFQVDIANPAPSGVTQVSNQGRVASDQRPVVLTDDPAVAGNSDPTRTTIVAAPLLRASKTATLLIDADANGSPSPGDTLLYQVRITNSGNTAATGITLVDTPDPNSTLVVASVTSDHGTVSGGNGGTPPVVVNIGTLVGGGDSANVSFQVTINSPLPAGVTQLSNQGLVTSNERSALLTDDPSTANPADATVTAITTAPQISAIKVASLDTDADGNGAPSPGDTLLYTVTITNSGNTAGTATFLNDIGDANAPLVVGSVQTTSGSVTTGNTVGDTSVLVDIGSIPGGGSSSRITFRVLITTPLPANVTSVSNQATIRGGNFPTLVSDDPATAAASDPTVTAVTAAPSISLTKTAVLEIDADANGIPSPGDTLLYRLLLRNGGNQAATDITLTDVPDANTTLIVGSVQSTAGGVASGNTLGDTAVQVGIAALPGGSSARITFHVTVNDPLPSGTIQVANQARVTGANFPAELSDDPTTTAQRDPTITTVTATPNGSADKTVALLVDADGNGMPSPGDTLLYLIRVLNTGNGSITGAMMSDTPDPNTTLVAGSVHVSQGTVTTGNTVGDTSVAVNIGAIPGRGGTFTMSFEVTINDPLPAGVVQVSNQAVGSSNELPLVVSNDPNTPPANDATVTLVTAAPGGRANKTVTLFNDADHDGRPSPGDTLLYRIDVVNTGNGAATGAFLTDTPDPNTQLVAGSVQASQGTVSSGNGPSDTNIAISIGTIPGRGGVFTASFLVTIRNPLPPGVTQVANQAAGGSNELPFVVTDDPATAAPNDTTVTQVSAAPVLFTSKRDALFNDADGNGVPSPGDTLVYIVEIRNTGNTAATGVGLNDTIDVNSALVVGSVQTSAGVVTLGNTMGDTSVAVSIGTIPAGGAPVTISFLVLVPDPLNPGVDFLGNQAVVTSNELAPVLSYDPDTQSTQSGPTITLVTAIPAGRADKTVILHTDADGNGVPSPGDTLLYSLEVVNTGNGAGTGAVASDTLDPNTTLVVGSVTASQGTITSGNTIGDTIVSLDIGTIPARGGVFTASFLATIDNPLPAGVTQLSNQFIGSSNELPLVVSNDPATVAPNDPTVVAVFAKPNLIADKTDILFLDADGSGGFSAGDTIEYQVTITNTGSVGASNVVFTDLPSPDTSLVAGSVTTSQGTIVSGNAGTPPVEVQLGTIAGGGGSATISFRTTIANPLPIGITRINNQGVVRSDELPDLPTNDPDTTTPNDPTITSVSDTSFVRAWKSASLFQDNDGNGSPSAGDVLQYNLTIRNDGSQPALTSVLSDTPGANTSLVSGSVSTSQGSVTTGNGVGDTSVQVALGTLTANGGSATVSFRVTIADPLAEGILEVSNQALVSGSNFTTRPSDDPRTAALDDPTRTAVTMRPALSTAKAAVLLIDADNNRIASSGDTILYAVTVRNNGNFVADNLVFTDTPDPNTTIVAGSVRTSQGTITSGNAGSPPVTIALGDLAPGGAAATISFAVLVNGPLPPNITQVANQGTVSGDNVTPRVTDDPRTLAVDDATVVWVGTEPILVATKSVSVAVDADGNGVGSAGDTLLYTIVIRNDGNLTASGVVFSDTPDSNTQIIPGSVQTSGGTITNGNAGAPPVTVNIGGLGGGGSMVTLSFQVQIHAALPPNTTAISNQGMVNGSNFTALATDDPSTAAAGDATITAIAANDLSITKTHTGAFQVGVNGRYILRVANVGTAPTSSPITVTDPLPPGLSFLSATGVGWSCGAAGQLLTCTRNTPLTAGSMTTIFLDVAVGSAAFPTLTNSATVSMAGDSNAGNNTAHDPTTVRAGTPATPTWTPTPILPATITPGGPTLSPTRTATLAPTATPTLGPPPDLGLIKSHVGAFTVGTTGTYTLTVRNFGAGVTTGVTTLTDVLPAGLTFAGGNGNGWTCGASGQTVTCTTAQAIAPNATTLLTLVVNVGAGAFPTVTNTATVHTARDANANNNSATDPTTVRMGATATVVAPPPTLTLTPAQPPSPTPTGTLPTATVTPSPTPSGSPTATAMPTATITPRPCALAISKTHSGKVRPGRSTKFQILWSNSCSDGDTMTIVDELPAELSFVSISAVSNVTAEIQGNTITLRAPRRAGVDSATITARVDAAAPLGNTICNRVSATDSIGRSTEAQDCFPIAGLRGDPTLLLKGHRKSRPGRELTYTARYFNVPAENTLTLTLPDFVNVLRIANPQPVSSDGRTFTWRNLTPVSGKVQVTVLLEPTLDFGVVLPATAELSSAAGNATANHSTVVVLPGRN